MIGDEYLQVREQLGTALFSLSTLAHGSLAGREVLQALHDLRVSLREPFLFLVAGGEKSGKSSLVNALFGREIIPAVTPPDPDKIHIYKYGPEEHDMPVYEQFIEHYRSAVPLRDFNIVDTPASAVITHQHLAVVEQLLPAVDLVLFVFSINDPWAAPSWEFLDYLCTKLPKKAVFVLQQSDLRDAPEVEAIAEHLAQNIRDKFPGESRVFPVSAKKAFLSKTTAADPAGLFQQSNFGPLESYINDITAGCEERISGLRGACVSAEVILREIGGKTRAMYSLVKNDAAKLETMNHDLEDRKSQALRQAGGIQWAVAQCYERMQKRGEEILQPQGSFFKSRSGARDENQRQSADAMLEDSIRRQIQGSMDLLEEDLQQAWPRLYETLRKQFPAESRVESAADPANERTPMLQQAELFLVEKMSPQFFEQHAARIFAGMAGWLEIPAAVNRDGFKPAVASLTRLAMNDFHDTLTTATALQGKIMGLGNRGKALALFTQEMAHKREELVAKLEEHLRQALDLFYSEIETAFQPLRNFSIKQVAIFEPRMTLLNQMEETLDKTAASLGMPARNSVMAGGAN